MIGIINFTHSDHLYSAYREKDLVVRDTPKNIMKKILSGELDCGMVSLFEYFENQEKLSIVESATIHSLKGTMSTLLVTRADHIVSPMTIAVTEHTRTTAVYLELVLQKMNIHYNLIWSEEREAEALLREADYALVIGDEALRVYSTNLRIIWDLGYQFNSLYAMMPVFSVTVKSRSKECQHEVELLDQAISDSVDHVDECVSVDSRKLGISQEILKKYFHTIRFQFDAEVKKTIQFLSKIYNREKPSPETSFETLY